ncbi:MAG TPA: sorbosone dehydrogenase family protein [Acidobacteria bacterium]|jgi:glucose/arabinose dehydrogenase|nr:sorbosone dehydrogenase family protein [Acidobacteriota bacterium]
MEVAVLRNLAAAAAGLVVATGSVALAQNPSLDRITLPPGFSIEVYAPDVPNARSMARSPSGTLFVSTRQAGSVYAVVDRDQDYRADEVITLASGLNMPNGVAFRDGALYVAEVNRILRYDDIEGRLQNPPEAVVVDEAFPTERSHGWKFIRFGPDGKLYVPVGAPCNICDRTGEDQRFGTITRMNPDGSGQEVFAHGVRNSVGFDWHPATGELWFTSNGRDRLGDTSPGDTLNYAPDPGMHFGFPFCHQGDTPDPEFGERRGCDEFAAPAQVLGPHVASLGMRFYTGSMFPASYRNQIFIAEHGSWNRTPEAGHTGYRITVATLDGNQITDYSVFAEGWLGSDNNSWGRPTDIEVLPDGSLLVTDDGAGAIYRITYDE